jgi:hypothetical protein
MRLDASIVKFKGLPYLAYASGFSLNLFEIADKNNAVLMYKNVSFKDSRLDITAIDIGYANLDEFSQAFYITRTPVRKQKQGSCGANLVSAAVGHKSFSPLPHEHLFNKGIRRAIVGDYPPLVDAVVLVNSKEYKSRGLSPNFAIIKNGKSIDLYFDQSLIGEIVPDPTTEAGFSAKLRPIYSDSNAD